MHEAETLELPLGLVAPTKREKSKLAKLWDHFQEVRAALKDHGMMLPQHYAADLVGVSRQRVHQLVNEGRFTVVEIGGCRYITELSLLEFAKTERAAGRHLTVPGVRATFQKAVDCTKEIASKKT